MATDVTRVLSAIEQGDRQAAEFLPLVYVELRKLTATRLASSVTDVIGTLPATSNFPVFFLKATKSMRSPAA